MLKEHFFSLVEKYSITENFSLHQWEKLSACYGNSTRHYHDLSHVENMFYQLEAVRNKITNYDTVLFAMYYHDVVYDARRTDNEAQSAFYFEEVISQTNFDYINECKELIQATAGHKTSEDSDTNLFLDVDLSILGASEGDYKIYSQQIRKEYGMYKDEIYFEGRKKVLLHFLKMKSIFKTSFFREKFEQKARNNMRSELELIS